MILSPATVAAFSELLARMERSVASKVGAGVPALEAASHERWRADVARNLDADAELADEVLAAIRLRLEGATTVAEVHAVFRRMRAGVAALVPG